MSHLDFSRYSKRIVKLLWDPEPKNEVPGESSIWCLGIEYKANGPPKRDTENGHNPDISTDPPFPPPDITATSRTRPALSTNNESYVKISRSEEIPSEVNGSSMILPQSPLQDASDTASSTGTADGWPVAFVDDFESRIWLTYRSAFPPISKSTDPSAASGMSLSVRLKSQLASPAGFTSDTGWGCMIRSGQSILANAFVLLHFGRDWRKPHSSGVTSKASAPDAETGKDIEEERPTQVHSPELQADLEEKRLLSLFADDPQAPFSIHKFVAHGATACNTHPGQWFGPSATAQCIRALANAHEPSNLQVYVTGDGPDIYADELIRIAKRGGDTFLPLLLLVGTRLGIDRVTPVYREGLAEALQMPQSVGIAGGRPSSSHYFIGVQDTTSFFYLDPHTTRPALPYHEDAKDYTEADVATCHTRRLRRIGVDEMDPSMLIAFLFRNEEEWESWRASVKEAPGKAIFHVLEGEGLPEQGQGPLPAAGERPEAIDEVETFDDEDEDEPEADAGAHTSKESGEE